MNQLFKIVAITCLVACVSGATPRRLVQIVPSASQVVPQAISPNDANKQLAQQAKLHYMEIGPSLKGDYKFGYDTGSGPAGQSFREETRLDDGTVKGAYGYVDANGKQRIVKYTAGKAGFVVESDQEAGKQGNQAAPAPAPAQETPQPVHRPTPAALPQNQPVRHSAPVAAPVAPQHHQQQPQQPTGVSFDEPTVPALTRQQAEQQHAAQLRQHQLAQQHALAQQQQLAQQQEQQQQLLIQQQQQQAALSAQQQQAQQHHHHQQAPVAHAQPQFSGHHQQPQQAQHHQAQQSQFGALAPQQPAPHAQQAFQHQPQAPVHQAQPAPIVHQFNQNGHFFAQSNDANLGQLLAQQLQQLQQQQQQQQQPQFQGAPQPEIATPAQIPQRFAPQQQQFTAPSFETGNQGDFVQPAPVRASRHAHFTQPQSQQHQPQQVLQRNVASPQSALLALHQQQQHDAQILANLRAQQMAQFEQQQRQQQAAAAAAPVAQPQAPVQQPQHQSAPTQQFVPAQRAAVPHQARLAQVAPQQQQAFAAGPVAEQPAPAQPEVFGPPVIDIRTLNYSIGQQTRVQ